LRARGAYLAIALGLVAIVVWGFWKTYFGPLLSGVWSRPWFIHLHAVVFLGWLALLVSQAALVSSGRVHAHRRVGQVGMVYGTVVLCVGLLVSVVAPAVRVRAGQLSIDVAALVALYNLTDMLLFGAFLALAFAYRNRPELHKRWILAATAALCGAALGRVVPGASPQYLLLWLSPLLAMIVADLAIRRRVHWIPVLSGALLVVAFFKVPLLAAPLWRDVGRALLRPFV
jgi:hypothetical protein